MVFFDPVTLGPGASSAGALVVRDGGHDDRVSCDARFRNFARREVCGRPVVGHPAAMEITGIITAIIIGLIIGALGRLVVPGKQNIPIWLTILIGIVAAIIGTFLASALGVNDTKGIDWIELLIQVVLAAVGVGAVAGVYGRRR